MSVERGELDEKQDTRPAEPLVRQIPPHPVASPTDMPHDDGGPWWTPSWTDVIKTIGWRWVLALPAAAVVILLLLAWFVDLRAMMPLWFLGIKVIIVLVAAPFLVLLELTRNAVRMRKEPFCIHCGYGLNGLPDDHTCPECGRPYTFAHIDEYRRDPHWYVRRYKMRGSMPRADAPFMAGPVRSKRSRDGT
jgi:hypothetical protein